MAKIKFVIFLIKKLDYYWSEIIKIYGTCLKDYLTYLSIFKPESFNKKRVENLMFSDNKNIEHEVQLNAWNQNFSNTNDKT